MQPWFSFTMIKVRAIHYYWFLCLFYSNKSAFVFRDCNWLNWNFTYAIQSILTVLGYLFGRCLRSNTHANSSGIKEKHRITFKWNITNFNTVWLKGSLPLGNSFDTIAREGCFCLTKKLSKYVHSFFHYLWVADTIIIIQVLPPALFRAISTADFRRGARFGGKFKFILCFVCCHRRNFVVLCDVCISRG